MKLNKEYILNILRLFSNIGFNRNKYVVSYGAAMVLQGFKETAKDIDLAVTLDMFILFHLINFVFKFINRFIPELRNDNYILNYVDVFWKGKMKTKIKSEELYGFQVQTKDSLINEKIKRGLEKDIKDLNIIYNKYHLNE